MAASIYNWSTTAADNGTADADVNWQEGQAPSTVNGSAREMMARNAELLGDLGGALTAGGTANALTVTANSAFSAYANGLVLALRIATDNTGAATLNVNSIGDKSIRKMVAAGESALTGAELQATGIYLLMYSAALNAAAGGWLLLNPTIDVPNLVTLTGTQTLTNKSLTSPALTGTPTTPTATAGTDTTQVASTAFVTAAVAALSTIYQAASAVLTALAGIGTAVAGDVIYASGAGTWARRAKGTASQALLMNTGATAPVWATLPFTKSYESAQQTISSSGLLTLSHGLGVAPDLVQLSAVCVSAEQNYSVGDVLIVNPGMDSGSGSTRKGVSVTITSTSISLRFSVGSPFSLVDKTTGDSNNNMTNSSWKLVVKAWA